MSCVQRNSGRPLRGLNQCKKHIIKAFFPQSRMAAYVLSTRTIAFALLLLAQPIWAAQNDPCSSASSVSDVHFSLALKDGRTVFQEGEIIPLVLSFTSTTKNRYWADVRNYDRSGRLGTEYYCVEPEAPDPLASYFKLG